MKDVVEMPPAIAISGAAGRMGQMLLREILQRQDVRLHAALVRPGHPWAGQDIGVAMGGPRTGVIVGDDPIDAILNAKGIIDFSHPQYSVRLATLAAQARIPHIIGTTGFKPHELEAISRASFHAPIVRAGNMSLGINLLTALTRQVSQALGESFDIEIMEAHHNKKIDAPSGTALMLGEAASEGRGACLSDLKAPPYDGIIGEREEGKIGFSVIRGGDIVGEHEVLFLGEGERIAIKHMATDRAIFARGALRAVLWAQDQPPGQYDMRDVLGLTQ